MRFILSHEGSLNEVVYSTAKLLTSVLGQPQDIVLHSTAWFSTPFHYKHRKMHKQIVKANYVLIYTGQTYTDYTNNSMLQDILSHFLAHEGVLRRRAWFFVGAWGGGFGCAGGGGSAAGTLSGSLYYENITARQVDKWNMCTTLA